MRQQDDGQNLPLRNPNMKWTVAYGCCSRSDWDNRWRVSESPQWQATGVVEDGHDKFKTLDVRSFQYTNFLASSFKRCYIDRYSHGSGTYSRCISPTSHPIKYNNFLATLTHKLAHLYPIRRIYSHYGWWRIDSYKYDVYVNYSIELRTG